jgi:hypothetical protein
MAIGSGIVPQIADLHDGVVFNALAMHSESIIATALTAVAARCHEMRSTTWEAGFFGGMIALAEIKLKM